MSGHLCGCYYTIHSHDYYVRFQKHYLPLVSSSAHSTILSTTSRTVLTQTFTNPSTTDPIKSCIYTFPLYDGVSVVSFTCRIGDKVLTGLVKEKFKAKKIFDDAVAKGETAGLLEQAPEAADVFSTKLGNIPAGESIIVEVAYVGELKHTETEGIRFTIPTSIAPRYGSGPAVTYGQHCLQSKEDQGIKITVDVKMPEGSNIKGVQSPSHPISVSLGTISTAKNADPSLSKASATLSLGSAALEKDFVLIVSAKDVGIPKAFLETHPTIPNHRALMATLVPKFALPPSRPEIVFVADRSGSMSGNIEMLVSAMTVFLKSLPSGVKFNICSFGSSYSFLWQKSQAYTAETLSHATEHLKTFSANMGGTETFSAIKATVDRRFTDLPLEIMLLTDGDIWSQNVLFEYVNKQVEETKGKIRIFPLGIGSGVSHSLIEGLARAGNGFASAVQDGERLDTSVVKMLRGALSPHITDYTLEVKYEQEDDDFEVIEKVTAGMNVLLAEDDKSKPFAKASKAVISLFDTKVDPEKDDVKGSDSPTAHLPNIPFPHLHQAPHKIPSLYAFSRTSVYLLLSQETIQRNPTSIILKATSDHGPLSLEIPVEALPEPGTTIHQLAAKKAVQDLEEGRGWIYDAKDQNGKSVKKRFPSCFQELVEKDAVRLGEKFQIAGKWTSFVAVAANDKEIHSQDERQARTEEKKEPSEGYAQAQQSAPHPIPPPPPPYNAPTDGSMNRMISRKSAAPSEFGQPVFGGAPPPPAPMMQGIMRGEQMESLEKSSVDLSKRAKSFHSAKKKSSSNIFSNTASSIGGLFGSRSSSSQSQPLEANSTGLFGGAVGSIAPSAAPINYNSSHSAPDMGVTSQAGLDRGANFGFGAPTQQCAVAPKAQYETLSFSKEEKSKSEDKGSNTSGGPLRLASYASPGRSGLFQPIARSVPSPQSASRSASLSQPGKLTPQPISWSNKTPIERLHAIIALQDFEGSWSSSAELEAILGFKIGTAPKGVDEKVWVTLLVLKVLDEKLAEEEGTWGLVGEKAREWLAQAGGGEAVEEEAGKVVEMGWN